MIFFCMAEMTLAPVQSAASKAPTEIVYEMLVWKRGVRVKKPPLSAEVACQDLGVAGSQCPL